MNFHDIQAFLAIVKYGTISKAADELYISQTAVTRRLKTLEDELGIPLLDRGRGIKESTLTPSGRDFLSIAQRWNAVWEETQRFKSLGERLSLSIGSVQILNDYVFPALYSRLLTHSPGMNLYIHTEHAIEFPPLVEQRIIDVAIGWRDSESPELSCQPWRQSPLVCVMPGDPQESAQAPVDPRRLDCTKELYINWPPSFTQWHEAYWPADQFHPSYVASAQLALQIMAHSGSWAVMPLFFAKYACQKGTFAYQYLTDPPEPLTAYILTHKTPRPNVQKSLSIFFEYLKQLDDDIF